MSLLFIRNHGKCHLNSLPLREVSVVKADLINGSIKTLSPHPGMAKQNIWGSWSTVHCVQKFPVIRHIFRLRDLLKTFFLHLRLCLRLLENVKLGTVCAGSKQHKAHKPHAETFVQPTASKKEKEKPLKSQLFKRFLAHMGVEAGANTWRQYSWTC